MQHERFYKHMPRAVDNSTISTGTISLRVTPNADVRGIAMRLATECRIPEHAVIQQNGSTSPHADFNRAAEKKGREITFHLTWQRVGKDVEFMRRQITNVLLGLGPENLEEIIQIEVLNEEEVTAREEALQKQQAPVEPLRLLDIA